MSSLASLVAQMVKKETIACNVGDTGSISGLARYLEKGMATHSSILEFMNSPEFHGQRSLVGYSQT